MKKKQNWFVLAGFLLTFVTASVGWADELHDGISALEAEDFPRAFSTLKPLADKNNSDAQDALAYMYINGNGVTKDVNEGIRLWRAAAEHGHLLAQYHLGDIYTKSNYVSVNLAETRKWWLKAAEKGELNAIFGLALMNYRENYAGQHVKANYKEAMRWFVKSTEVDPYDCVSMKIIGDMYRKGEGVAIDLKSAANWYHGSYKKGCFDAIIRYAAMFESGDGGVEKSVLQAFKIYSKAPDKLKEDSEEYLFAQKGIGRLLPEITRMAEQGDINAMVLLNDIYYSGFGVSKNIAESTRWIRSMADSGDVWAETELGVRYLKGIGVPANDKDAVTWLTKAAIHQDPYSARRLGEIFENGGSGGVSKDIVEAAHWFLVATAGIDKTTNPDEYKIAKYGLDRVVRQLSSEQYADAKKRANVK